MVQRQWAVWWGVLLLSTATGVAMTSKGAPIPAVSASVTDETSFVHHKSTASLDDSVSGKKAKEQQAAAKADNTDETVSETGPETPAPVAKDDKAEAVVAKDDKAEVRQQLESRRQASQPKGPTVSEDFEFDEKGKAERTKQLQEGGGTRSVEKSLSGKKAEREAAAKDLEAEAEDPLYAAKASSAAAPAAVEAAAPASLQAAVPAAATALAPAAAPAAAQKVQVKSSVSAAAPKGTTALAVVSQSDFQIGEEIVIDYGTPIEEYNKVVGFGSLVLETPLKFDHPAGALVGASGASVIGNKNKALRQGAKVQGPQFAVATGAVPAPAPAASPAAAPSPAPRYRPKALGDYSPEFRDAVKKSVETGKALNSASQDLLKAAKKLQAVPEEVG